MWLQASKTTGKVPALVFDYKTTLLALLHEEGVFEIDSQEESDDDNILKENRTFSAFK